MVSTYSEAGVDIDASERATEALIAQIKGVNRKGDGEAIQLDNGFAGLVKLGDGALAMCTDGVGSKLLLAEEKDSIHTVGIDCVAMNTNDLICVGAEPLSFVDYVALDKPDEELIAKKLKSNNSENGCNRNDDDDIPPEFDPTAPSDGTIDEIRSTVVLNDETCLQD